jgi:hypothetical protein
MAQRLPVIVAHDEAGAVVFDVLRRGKAAVIAFNVTVVATDLTPVFVAGLLV